MTASPALHPHVAGARAPTTALAKAPEAIVWVAAAYVLLVASGALGVVDIVQFGVSEGGRVLGLSIFSRYAWPIAYLLFTILALRCWPEVLDAAVRTWWILLLPLVGVLSISWSLDATVTANAALRLAVSALIGLYLGVAFGLEPLLRLTFWVLIAAVGLSVLVALAGLDFAIMFDGKARGIFYHKNQLGNRAVILVATALVLWLVARRSWVLLLGAAIGIPALVLAGSATSFVAALAAAATVVAIAVVRGRSMHVGFRIAVVGALATVLAFALVITGTDPLTGLFDILDRDPTLTGRRLLWDAAWGQIYARPLLGTGLDAFWAVAVDWRTLQVLDLMGHVGHFHNTYLEVAVQLGAVGLTAALATLLFFVWQALRLALRLERMVDLWPIAFAVAVIVPTVAEYEIFLKHSLTGILMVAIAAAMARSRGPASIDPVPPRAHPSPRPAYPNPPPAHPSRPRAYPNPPANPSPPTPARAQPPTTVRWPLDQRVRRKADRAEP